MSSPAPKIGCPSVRTSTPARVVAALHSDLLAQNGPDRELEPTPAARDPQSRLSLNSLRQYRVRLQAGNDRGPVRAQIKHGAQALNNEKQRAWIAELHAHHERVVFLVKADVRHSHGCRSPKWNDGTGPGRPTRRRALRARPEIAACHPSCRAGGSEAGKDTDFPAEEPACRERRRICRGVRLYTLRIAALKRRTQPKPDASATSLIGNFVSSMSFFAKCRRRVCATALGVAPRWCTNRRRKWREPTPKRSARPSTPPSSRPLSAINRRARDTVLGVPSQAGVPGEHSGRQRRQGRNPASAAAAALGK